MPTEKTSTRALTGPRVLTKQFEMADMTFVAPTPSTGVWENAASRETEWRGVVGKAIAYNEQYFDLSGYELDDLTLATVDVKIQDPGIYTYSGDADVFACYDIISQERLSEADLEQIKFNNTTLRQSAPGQALGPLDRSQVVSGTYRLFAKNANIASLPTLMLNQRTVRFGSGNATAVQKLWVYRLIVFIVGPSAGDVLVVPASTVVLMGNVVKEDEIPYLMRLKRSYELAQE
jgi:hypothetical protein